MTAFDPKRSFAYTFSGMGGIGRWAGAMQQPEHGLAEGGSKAAATEYELRPIRLYTAVRLTIEDNS